MSIQFPHYLNSIDFKILADFVSVYVQVYMWISPPRDPHHHPQLTLFPKAKHFRNRSVIRKSNSKTTNLVLWPYLNDSLHL